MIQKKIYYIKELIQSKDELYLELLKIILLPKELKCESNIDLLLFLFLLILLELSIVFDFSFIFDL